MPAFSYFYSGAGFCSNSSFDSGVLLMSKNWDDCKKYVLNRIAVNIQKNQSSRYYLENGKIIIFRCSRLFEDSKQNYWFGIPKKLITKNVPIHKGFLLLICGQKDQVIVLSIAYIIDMLKDFQVAQDGNWKFHVEKDNNKFKLLLTAGKTIDISQYLNKFELINDKIESLKEPLKKQDNSSVVFQEKVSKTETYHEGRVKKIKVNLYERNTKARKRCIEHYGFNCFICQFNFEKVYGELGKNLIHVHHLTPLSERRDEYQLDPIKDLRPVCPNCHAVLHSRKPAYSIEDIKNAIGNNS